MLSFAFCVGLGFSFSNTRGDTLTINETSISEGQYESRQDITEVKIPNTVRSIPENAFANCTNLHTVYIHPAYELKIKRGAFRNSGIKRVIFTDETFERPSEYIETVHLEGAAITGSNIEEIILGEVKLTGGATTTGIINTDNQLAYPPIKKITIVSNSPKEALSGNAIFWRKDFDIISSYEYEKRKTGEENEKTQKPADMLGEFK